MWKTLLPDGPVCQGVTVSIHRQLPSRHPALPFVVCHDGTGLRYEPDRSPLLGGDVGSRPSRTAQEPRSARTGIEATLEN
jgi:hypothetical protein